MPQQLPWQVPQHSLSQQCQADKEEYKHRTIRNQIPLQRMIFGKRRAFPPAPKRLHHLLTDEKYERFKY